MRSRGPAQENARTPFPAHTKRVSPVAHNDGHIALISYVLSEKAEKLFRPVRPRAPMHEDHNGLQRHATSVFTVMVNIEQASCGRRALPGAGGRVVGHIKMLAPCIKKSAQEVEALDCKTGRDQRPGPFVKYVPGLPPVAKEARDAMRNDARDRSLAVAHER